MVSRPTQKAPSMNGIMNCQTEMPAARYHQFAAPVERDQYRHADEEGDERHSLLQNERQPDRRHHQAEGNGVPGQSREPAGGLTEIDEVDDGDDTQEKPEGRHDVADEEVTPECAEDHAPLPLELPGVAGMRSWTFCLQLLSRLRIETGIVIFRFLNSSTIAMRAEMMLMP